MFGALSQLAESQGFSQKPSSTFMHQTAANEVKQQFSLEVKDPLRELVLYSNNEDADPQKLKFLADSAANLVAEVADQSSNTTSKNMKVLTGIFAGTGTFIKNVESNISKKYSALEPSDSEEFGGMHLANKYCIFYFDDKLGSLFDKYSSLVDQTIKLIF